MYVDDDKCAAYGVDVKEVARIARGLSRYGREAEKLGLIIFGGAGSGSLRAGGGCQSVVADLDGNYDGGDGGDEF